MEFHLWSVVCFEVWRCFGTKNDRAGLPQGKFPAEVSFLAHPKAHAGIVRHRTTPATK